MAELGVEHSEENLVQKKVVDLCFNYLTEVDSKYFCNYRPCELYAMIKKYENLGISRMSYGYKKNQLFGGCASSIYDKDIHYSIITCKDLHRDIYRDDVVWPAFLKKVSKIESPLHKDANVICVKDIFDTAVLGDLSTLENCYALILHFNGEFNSRGRNGTHQCDKVQSWPPNLKFLELHNYYHPLDNLPPGVLILRLDLNYNHSLNCFNGIQHIIFGRDGSNIPALCNSPPSLKVLDFNWRQNFNEQPDWHIGLEEYILYSQCFSQFIDSWVHTLKKVSIRSDKHFGFCPRNLPPALEHLELIPSKSVYRQLYYNQIDYTSPIPIPWAPEEFQLPPTCKTLILDIHTAAHIAGMKAYHQVDPYITMTCFDVFDVCTRFGLHPHIIHCYDYLESNHYAITPKIQSMFPFLEDIRIVF